LLCIIIIIIIITIITIISFMQGIYTYISETNYVAREYSVAANDIIWYDIYLTAIGLTPGGSITRHIYNKQYTQYIESTILEVRAVPRLCE